MIALIIFDSILLFFRAVFCHIQLTSYNGLEGFLSLLLSFFIDASYIVNKLHNTRREKGDEEFKALLDSELGHPVIIIPWTSHADDVYGHADGFIKWCGDNRILMGNHGDCYPEEATSIRRILECYGFVVTEMRFNDKVATPDYNLNWAYINFLQVGKNIIMPKFNIEEDAIAQQYIQSAFPNCSNIEQIEMAEIAKKGGALHCLTWNVYLPQSQV